MKSCWVFYQKNLIRIVPVRLAQGPDKLTMRIIFIFCFLACFAPGRAFTLKESPADSVVSVREFVKQAEVADSGFVNYYQVKGKHYLEIPDRILGRDILTTITILKGAQQNMRSVDKRVGYGGDSMNDDLVRFMRSGDKIDLVRPDVKYTENQHAAFRKFYTSLLSPIIHTFSLIARSDRSGLIDISDYYLGDSELFSLAGARMSLGLGAYLPQESYSERVASFPGNINFRSIRCYTAENPKQSTYPKLQWEVGASWFLLPEKPMKIRLADKRVGYFSTTIRGQVYNPAENELFGVVNRWRLEPKPEDVDKYLRGELVEPAKPIVFYIDRSIPAFLADGVKKAVTSWKSAFEQAGFKNAIQAKLEATDEGDDEFSVEDARFSYISYKASPVPNAYGPMIIDPRSGEVICSHVALFHSVIDLMQMWYFAMCSPADPEARVYPLKPELISKLVNTVVKHEVGHTLGLRHNFLGSTFFPVDSLRSNDFVSRNGIGTSIMDYERFNYVVQPGDQIARENLFPKIGIYDDFAINWGYRYFADTISAVKEADVLRQWVSEEQKKGGRYYIVESANADPRVQAEDCGDDQIYANELGMKNLQYVMSHLEDWTDQQSNNDYELLKRRFYYVLHQYETYIDHVVHFLGGYYTEDCSRGEKTDYTYRAVSGKEQQRAIEFLGKYFLNEPVWLFKPGFIDKVDFNLRERVGNFAFARIGQLMVSSMTYSTSEAIDPQSTTYNEFLTSLYNLLFSEEKLSQPVSDYTRLLQRAFLTQLTINLENQGNIPYNIAQELKQTIDKLKIAAQRQTGSPDAMTRVHYQSIVNFISIWETGTQKL